MLPSPFELWNYLTGLQKVLNFGLRVISGRRKFDHISDVRGALGWPTARQLYELHSLCLLHKIRNTEEPLALSSQLRANSTLRSRSTRQDGDLALPRVRTEAGRRRLLFNTVQQYNGLPPEVRLFSVDAFKRTVADRLVGWCAYECFWDVSGFGVMIDILFYHLFKCAVCLCVCPFACWRSEYFNISSRTNCFPWRDTQNSLFYIGEYFNCQIQIQIRPQKK